MAEYIIDADSFGAFYLNVGNNQADDQVTINIGTNFSGTITVDSQPGDSEYDTTIVNTPNGWTLNIVKLVEDGSIEDPSYKDYSYQVYNAEGQSVGTLSIRSNNIIGAPCFTRGTMIETADGPRAIEALAAGDLIVTRDNGLQPLRWIGKIRVGMTRLAANPNLRPVRIAAGALAPSVPARDLLVSLQHRMLVRSRIAQRMFGTTEILVAAKQLLAIEGVDIADDIHEVDYFHMLFDRHEIVTANGAEAESLYTGAEALKSVGQAAREEIFGLFPELLENHHVLISARPMVSGRQGRKLVMRHIQNEKHLW